jgi:hypothetical protein
VKRAFPAALAAGAILAAGPAHAATFVGASDGIPRSAIALTSGETFQVSVNPASDADGADDITADIAVATAALPEPASWGLMILGSGMAGAMYRRRRAMTSGA